MALVLRNPTILLRVSRFGSIGKSLSTSPVSFASEKQSYKLVVVGGGAGGCAVAAKFTSVLPKGSIAIIEPADVHYYQPMWTLVGGGIKNVKDSARPMADVLPKKAVWIKEKATIFSPETNTLKTESGKEISYEYLVVAMGIQTDFNKIKGLSEAFETPGVCSNYSPIYANKTLEALKNFRKGNAIFTFPNTPIKCAGAPQKAMYISEEYLRKHGKRNDATVIFNTSLGVLFGVKKYADSLWDVVKKRNIQVNTRHELIEVKPDTREAVFRLLDQPESTKSFKYEMLHVSPPMSAPEILRANHQLTNEAGYLEVDKYTLQHVRFPNVFGLGDCTSLPTSKTAAAIAGQNKILYDNLRLVMDGKKDLTEKYNGYTSCPLVTGYSKCILAEFDYNGTPLETLPINQAKERRTSFIMKKDVMPVLYWKLMLNGYWNGPGIVRKIMHLGRS